ncbi:DUF6783 domain-containing protein [Blautia sp. HCN-1074]|uniref:DUF6783 domain-containing protein n=1 Tax=Blautia sp. HCN-1074 TaxID=3134667 RepID=UPI0040400553
MGYLLPYGECLKNHPANCDTHLAENFFQTCSDIKKYKTEQIALLQNGAKWTIIKISLFNSDF